MTAKSAVAHDVSHWYALGVTLLAFISPVLSVQDKLQNNGYSRCAPPLMRRRVSLGPNDIH